MMTHKHVWHKVGRDKVRCRCITVLIPPGDGVMGVTLRDVAANAVTPEKIRKGAVSVPNPLDDRFV